MKIAQYAVSQTAFLHLKSPDGTYLYEKGSPVGIDLYGPGSDEAAEVESRQSARSVKRAQDNDNKFAFPPLELQRAEALEDLMSLTAGFRNIEHDGADGQPLTGTDLYRAVYSDPAFGWIKVQAFKFSADWGKFLPGSTGS